MPTEPKRLATLLLGGVLLTALPADLSARQEEAPADTIDAVTRYQAALDTIATLDGAIGRIDAWAENREQGYGRLLATRREARIDARRALYWRLAELAPELPDSTAREAAVLADSLLAADAEILRTRFVGNVNIAADLNSALEDLEGPDRARVEQQLHLIDVDNQALMQAFQTSLVHRDSLGADVATEAADLNTSLNIVAELLAGRMALTEQDIDRLRERLDRGETGLEATVAALDLRTTQTANSLRDVLTLMEERELPTADYRRFLLVSTGELTAEDLNWDVVTGLITGWFDLASAWLAANSANIVFKILLVLAILALFRIIAAAVNHVLKRTYGRSKTSSKLLRDLVLRWSTRIIMLLGFLIALSQVGVEVGPLLAGLGVAGFIVGFALQDSLANLAAGVMILLYRPFDMNDVVEVGGVNGKVDDMSMVSTTILSPDNQRYVVPNSKIWGNVIRNVTAQDTRRVDLTVGIGYESDVPTAEKLLNEIVHEHPLVLKDPEPSVKVSKLTPIVVEFAVRPWCRTNDVWTVTTDITRSVKVRFDEEGIAFK